jgi:hypothetical protein
MWNPHTVHNRLAARAARLGLKTVHPDHAPNTIFQRRIDGKRRGAYRRGNIHRVNFRFVALYVVLGILQGKSGTDPI